MYSECYTQRRSRYTQPIRAGLCMYSECYTRHIYYDETSLNSLTDCVCIVRERKEFSEKKKECLNSLTDCVCIVRNNYTI